MTLTPRKPVGSLLAYLPAVLFALLSNYFFTGEFISRFNDTNGDIWGKRQVAGAVFLFLAVGASIWAFRRQDDLPRWAPTEGRSPSGTPGLRAFLPALTAYLLSNVIYLVMGETPVVRWTWLLGIVLLLLPLWRQFSLKSLRSIAAWEYLLLVIVVFLAFMLRYNDIDKLPLHVDNDVSIMGLRSRRLIENNDWRWVGMAMTVHSLSEHQFIAWSMRLFGVSLAGLSMFSILAGSATCIVVYGYGRILFNRWVGLLAAAFLAFNYVHIHFSRQVFGPLATLFVAAAGLFLVHGLRTGRLLSFALGGVGLGAGLLDYYSARIGPVLAIGLFVLWWLQRRKHIQVGYRHWAVALLGTLVVFGPNLIYGMLDFAQFRGRGQDVILWTKPAWTHLTQKYNADGNVMVVLWEQTKRTLLAPFYFPDESTICHLRKPMLGAFAAISFILGLGFCLRRCLRFTHAFLLLWAGATFLFGGILTIDPPFWPHLNIAVPALSLIAAIGIERLFRRVAIECSGIVEKLAPAGLAAVVLFSGIHNWEVYYRFARDHAAGRVIAMRQIRSFSKEHRVYLISPEFKWEQETFQFFTPQIDGRNLSEQELLKNIPPIDKPTVFMVFEGTNPEVLKKLNAAFPHARREAFWDGWGWPVLTQVEVYPPNYVFAPQRFRPPEPYYVDFAGWRLIALFLVLAIALGCLLIEQESKEERSPSDMPDGKG